MSGVVTGRVLRRYSTYSKFYFLQLSWPELSDDSVFPLIVRVDDRPLPKVRPGDVIEVRGRMVDHVSEFYSNRCFEADHIVVLEAWDQKTSGIFQYVGQREIGQKAHTVNVNPRRVFPLLAVQCQVDVAERVEDYLRLTLTSDMSVRLSSATPTNGNDRLVLILSAIKDVDCKSVGERIVNDPILTYVVKRVYIASSKSSSVGLRLEDALHALPVLEPSTCRIHAYPKNLDIETVGKVLLPKSLQFHPKKYDSVLNIFFADGFHYVSLVDKSEALGCGDHLYSNTENVWVSKAAAKIREALARLDRLVPKKSDLSGKTAIDVGASPGGWSYFLKSDRKCARVIAVDMGLLAEPIPHGVEHWKMKGNEAIDKLLSESSGFLHLYACDMNCDPIDSVQLFLRALVLLAPESLAVITLKRTERNKERWQKIKSECQKMLKESDRVKSVIEVHLVANTPNETTLLIDLH